ncbi:MAG: hypothetical protein LBR94_07895 [Desulfovibrio sp.]|nr:hypothetical protein [Desulfovibrio sp.]
MGEDVYFDAWLYSMMMDNNLAWKMNPEFIASPERMAFMLHPEEAQAYLPCSDATFAMLHTERLNLTRVSVTFSRAWKEADILLGTSHEFTRDIICYWHDGGGFHVRLREHADIARKFNENDIITQSDAIIEKMRKARLNSQSIMFYSCIIGSIPGQTATAISLARVFVDNLRKKMDNTYIINPAEHFVEGMDGDDLMFMWERVQRSGYIDIWRFQTMEDIEESFALLNLRVPTSWQGMDSTYSTGCTKEMRIALDVQAKNREMQITGPEPRLFVRRSEYGIGKYFDAAFSRGASRNKN